MGQEKIVSFVLTEINAEIGLLIDTNVPEALEPLQVIRSVNDGPYSIRTTLGWTEWK